MCALVRDNGASGVVRKALLALTLLCAAACAPAEPRPDILLVITDDQGWGDWEGSGNSVIQTPHMMRLAEQGASFTDFHVAPVCAPTRAMLLSGRHSLETGVWGVTRGGERMATEVETLAELLRERGYRTALFGKWHNGAHPPFDPASQGFDHVFGFLAGHITDYFDPVLIENGREVQTRGYITTTFTDAALDWLEASDRPSFAVIAYNTPHSPFEVENRYLELYADAGLPPVTQAIYAMTTQTDAQFGRLLDAVDDDAVVIFVGDNGPARPGGVERYKDGLAGQKGSVLFGGTQVPMIIRWPGVTQAGSTITQPGHGTDLVPTVLRGLGAPVPNAVDGVDLAPALGGAALAERTLFTHHSNVLLDADTEPVTVDPGAARRGRFSAVLDPDGNWALYADRAQSVDVKTEHPAVFADLQAQYLAWFAEVSPAAMDDQPVPVTDAPVTLAAHDAYPGGAADFNLPWGWSQDWIVVSGAGTLRWPVIMEAGRYGVRVQYDGTGTLVVGEHARPLPAAEAAPRFAAPHHRRVVSSGEAITLDWPVADLGVLELPATDGRLVVGVDGTVRIKSLTLVPQP